MTDWDQAAREDAMGNIITVPGLTPDEFWDSGRHEIDQLMEDLDGRPARRRVAVDFGSGIGRLSLPLAAWFKQVWGVDSSAEMRKRAEPRPGVTYVPSMRGIHGVDLVYSNITLQHVPPDGQMAHIQQFVKALDPDGLAVFQVWVGSDVPHTYPWLSMFHVEPHDVTAWVAAAGGTVLDASGTNGNGDSLRFTVAQKQEAVTGG